MAHAPPIICCSHLLLCQPQVSVLGLPVLALYPYSIESGAAHAGFADPVYAEAYVTVHQYDIVLDVTVINRTRETLQNLCLELATMGDLKLVERPQNYTLGPGAQKSIRCWQLTLYSLPTPCLCKRTEFAAFLPHCSLLRSGHKGQEYTSGCLYSMLSSWGALSLTVCLWREDRQDTKHSSSCFWYSQSGPWL